MTIMSQMNSNDLKLVKAIQGNDQCCDCGMNHPQWASVSFGNVFCLECSGIHRSLGVHISFVRSIAMDSWTPHQLEIMLTGGNDKVNKFLLSKGVPKGACIKAKYESDAAALYKEILKARVEGRPEPTEIKHESSRNGKERNEGGLPNRESDQESTNIKGLERLRIETDEQYIARQTRLREEARQRMAAKFGNARGRRIIGGVGSSPPRQSNNITLTMDTLGDTLTSGLGTAASGFSSALSFAKDTVKSSSVKSVTKDVGNMSMGIWNTLSSATKEVASGFNVDMGGVVSGMSEDDGLSCLQERAMRERSVRVGGKAYDGFGSHDMSSKATKVDVKHESLAPKSTRKDMSTNTKINSLDPNGVVPFEGETDGEYTQRQVWIREKMRATPRTCDTSKNLVVQKNKPDDFFANFGA